MGKMRNAFVFKRGLVGLGALLATAWAAWAAGITAEQAKTAAGHWARRSPSPLQAKIGHTVREAKTYSDSGGQALFHVVRFEEGGFVVTSADDGVLPIVAFSENEDLAADARNPFWVLLNRDLVQRLAAARAGQAKLQAAPAGSGSSPKAEWDSLLSDLPANKASGASDIRVSPLVQSKWSQDSVGAKPVYNYYTPKNAVCGCVATAGSQIMRYHQYPTDSVSAGTYLCFVDGAATSLTMKGGVYEWSNMPLVPSASLTLAQQQAIGKLTYDVGVASYMKYTAWSSGALDSNLAEAFVNRFGYAKACLIMHQSWGVDGYLQPAVLPNLDAGYPVAFGIQGDGGGHEIVGDGYGFFGGLLYIHLNMGWAGSDDAWYNLPTVGTSYYSFSVLGNIIFNIFPTHHGEIISGRVLDSLGNPVGGASVVALNATTGESLPAVTSNDKGIYAVLVPEPESGTTHTYQLTASSGALIAQQTATVSASVSTEWTYDKNLGEGTYSPGTGSIGNCWGVELTLAEAPMLSVTPASFSVAKTAGSATFSVANTGVGTMAWTASVLSGGTWARVSSGASGSDAGSVKVSYDANPAGGAARVATIRLTAAGAAGSPVDVTVAQAANTGDSGSALPAWAWGAFNGFVSSGGAASLAVSSKGKITGKVAFGGTNYSFSAASYAGGDAEQGFAVSAVAKAGKALLPVSLTVVAGEAGLAPSTLGLAQGAIGSQSVSLYRNVWKDVGAAAALGPAIGYYTAALPSLDGTSGSGYLTFTVDKSGNVKTAGKLADGTAVSLSGALLTDGLGRLFSVVYAVPAAYKGGSLFGLAEFVDPVAGELCLRPLGAAAFRWASLNPQATPVYSEGFDREAGLVGGWFSKTEDLGAYYAGKALTAGSDTNAAAPVLAVGTNRYASVWWTPEGVALAPVLKAGALAGLAAPAAGKPVDPEADGMWDYSATNTVGLKITLTRATGVFKGSFLAWFDYPEKKHVSKKVSFEGALTPVREDRADGVAGRGFFLWADKGTYQNTAGKWTTYPFNWSYDFLIVEE